MSAISSLNNQTSIFQLANSITSSAPSSAGSLTSSSSGGSNISQAGQLFSDLQQLQQSNPAQFKTVVSQLANQFQAAAKQQGSATGSGILSSIANKLESVANGGSLSQSEGAQHHHHGHKGQQAYGSQSSQSQGLTQLLASLQNSSDSSSSSSSSSSGSSAISSVLTSALQTVTQALSS